MKQLLIKRKTVTYGDEFLAEMELSYYICEKSFEQFPKSRYAVRIVKETIENGARISEDNTTNFLFFTLDEVTSFIDMLIRYEVTPITLEDIACDYFSENFSQKNLIIA